MNQTPLNGCIISVCFINAYKKNHINSGYLNNCIQRTFVCMYMHVRMGRMCAQCVRMRECSCVRAWCGGDPMRARMSECWRDVQ